MPETNANWMNEALSNYLLVTATSKINLRTILFDFKFEQTYQVAKQTGKYKGLSLLQHATVSFGNDRNLGQKGMTLKLCTIYHTPGRALMLDGPKEPYPAADSLNHNDSHHL